MSVVGDVLTAVPGLSQAQIEGLERYCGLLLAENAAMNLTAVTDPGEVAVRHFLDSLCPPALALLPRGARLIDVGSGGGLPGIPLAIARPDLSVTLLEARRKKTDFLLRTAELLGLENVSVVWGRAEDTGRDPAHREQYDVATARAVAALPVLCELLLPFVAVGGMAFAWKGPAAREEMEAAGPALDCLGGAHPRLLPYAISHEFCHMHLFVCDKVRPTPPSYPRKAGKPAKFPLGRS